MTTSEFLWLVLPALLAVGLYLSLRREFDASAEERDWTGTGFEVGRLAPRMRRLREDYLSAVRSHSAHTCQHRAALTAARLTLAGRSFFQRSAGAAPPVDLPEPGHGGLQA
jgi:hypothetical protein